jgi:hypothetical protein
MGSHVLITASAAPASVIPTKETNAAARTSEIHAARVHSAAAETAMAPAIVFRVAVRLMGSHVLITASAAQAIARATCAPRLL